MNYELQHKLKDAGFPQGDCDEIEGDVTYEPSLSELIEACGDLSFKLEWGSNEKVWYAHGSIGRGGEDTKGETPEEAVANLWLELNKK